MTTRERPLLALYIWTDRVAEAARLVQAKPGAV
jgi:hypothetical protein